MARDVLELLQFMVWIFKVLYSIFDILTVESNSINSNEISKLLNQYPKWIL